MVHSVIGWPGWRNRKRGTALPLSDEEQRDEAMSLVRGLCKESCNQGGWEQQSSPSGFPSGKGDHESRSVGLSVTVGPHTSYVHWNQRWNAMSEWLHRSSRQALGSSCPQDTGSLDHHFQGSIAKLQSKTFSITTRTGQLSSGACKYHSGQTR